MPQFVVPQFIDVEDKIIGPITTRQFIMGVVVLLFLFLAYRLADITLFILEAVLLMGLYVLVAFVKVNGRPSYYFLLSMLRSIKRPQLRVWDKGAVPVTPTAPRVEKAADESTEPVVPKKKLAEGRLSSLALLVDTGGKYRPEEILKNQADAQVQARK
ncbi:MAG: PrgI family protein [Parcubacteria group bacterium]|nr:PrgI family protein [Parcubacteria group bacterium]